MQVSKLATGIKIVSFPILSKVMTLASSAAKSMPGVSQEDLSHNAHAKKIEAFYSSQAEYVGFVVVALGFRWRQTLTGRCARAYDAFRENFLHARSRLATCLPLPPGK